LLNAMTLNRIGHDALPKTAQGMGRRLDQAKWSNLKVLNDSDDARLKRKSKQRLIGIFRPGEVDPTEPLTLDDTRQARAGWPLACNSHPLREIPSA